MGDRFRLRVAGEGDLRHIVEIERRVFSDPWSAASLRELLTEDVLVATAHGRVVGYVFARRIGDQAEILNLAVEPEARHQGIGRALAEKVIAQLAAAGAAGVFLEVRVSNRAARALYTQLGFTDVGLRPRYYHRPLEDAVVMARKTSPDPQSQRKAPSRVSSVDKRT